MYIEFHFVHIMHIITWSLLCVTERADEASEGVDITLLGNITARVSLLHFVVAVYYQCEVVNTSLGNCVVRDVLWFTSSAFGEMMTPCQSQRFCNFRWLVLPTVSSTIIVSNDAAKHVLEVLQQCALSRKRKPKNSFLHARHIIQFLTEYITGLYCWLL